MTSLAHHITCERVWQNLHQIPLRSAPGGDGETLSEVKEDFERWIEPMPGSMPRKGYQALPIRRVYIPKPGKQEKRPLGVPCVTDRALRSSTVEVLSAIYEQDLLPCSFGGRRGLGAHHALSTLNEIIAGRKVRWELEAGDRLRRPGQSRGNPLLYQLNFYQSRVSCYWYFVALGWRSVATSQV